MKKIFISLLCVIFSQFFIEGVFASSWDVKTIREIQEKINVLEEEKTKLDFGWKNFGVWNETLWDIISELTPEEESKLKELIITFEEETNRLETKIERRVENNSDISEEQNELKQIKKDFYFSLLAFIDTDKLESFKTYISHNIQYTSSKTDVNIEIQKTELQKQQRLDEIQEKIEDNNKKIRENITEKLSIKIRWKVDLLIQDDRFSLLLDVVQGILEEHIYTWEDSK